MDGSGSFSTLNDCEQVCQNISSIIYNGIAYENNDFLLVESSK